MWQAYILQSLRGLQGTSLVSCHCPCGHGGLREVPLTGVDWLLVPGSGAAPKGSTKWHQFVDKWARFGKFKKGWFSSLQRIREREGSIQDTAPNSPGLLLSLRLY